MGDMSQIFLALNSYRSQVGLRLMEKDLKQVCALNLIAATSAASIDAVLK